jgi:hypothetical protein
MNQFDVFNDVRELMAQIVKANRLLEQAVLEGDVPVGFFCSDNTAVFGASAVTRVLAHVTQLEYTARCEPIDRPYGALCVPTHIKPFVQSLNDAKSNFKDYHQSLPQTHGLPVVDANKVIRAAVRAAGHDIPSLDAIDRQVIWVDEPVTQCQWYLNESTQNLRKHRNDLLSELDRLATAYSDSPHVFTIEQLYKDCARLPEHTPIAFRSKKPVHRLSCRITKLDEHHQRQLMIAYAANPFFFNASLVTPVFQKVGEGIHKEGSGRTRRINVAPIHPVLLPKWYFYTTPEPVSRTPHTTRTKNPHARTAFEGLWLGVKQRKNGPAAFVHVGVGDVSTSVSINRHGFDHAWAKAAAVYAPLVGRSTLNVIQAQPSEQQLRLLISHSTLNVVNDETGDAEKVEP